MIRVVVVGYGPVGARFVEGMLPAVRAGQAQVTVVGAEADDAYNRVLIAEYAVGRAARDRLDIADAEGWRAAGVDLRLAEAAVAIDRDRRVVRTSGGERLAYDRLVLATGSRANIPTIAGMERARRERDVRAQTADALDLGASALPRGVSALRDLADARRVAATVAAGGRIVVLGAGVLGLELALAAREQGAEVVVVHHGDVPMARNLDTAGGRMLARAARAAGIEMAPHSRAESLLLRTDPLDGHPRFDALVCADGKQIPGDLLLLSVGVSPRVELAVACGLRVSTGILVDHRQQSWTDPAVFAIGDCAHVAAPDTVGAEGRVPGGPSGLIGPGWQQADALSARWIAGAADDELSTADAAESPAPDRPLVVMLKAEGIDVVAGGVVDAEPWDDDVHAASCGAARQVTVWADPARGGYVKMVTRDGVLEGFVCVGMPRAGAELTLLYERRSELPADRAALLRLDAEHAGAPVATDALAPESTVCWCNGVTAARITDAVAAGADTVECIGSATRAGTGCGGCKGRVAELLARAST
ncbi:FAD-dependent oxidoreductase [Microbacterium sp. NPDC089189]|uniref:FAD-dependent oxidoreductase n=1 Tax=Microbacterium sp. NPDC089189 TaxID=3154972 RepID=UPI00342E2204